MIRIVHHQGRSCPTPYCDECEIPIEDAGMALFAWKAGENIVHFVHKGQCQRRMEKQFGGDSGYRDMEMRVLPVYLAGNMGMEPKKIKEVMKEITNSPML